MGLKDISARNVFKGTVVEIKKGNVTAEVQVDIGGGNVVTSTITVGSAERLGLEKGKPAAVVIKASDVMLGLSGE